MKKFCLLALAALLFLTLPLPVQADEPAKYNFASAQGDKDLKIQPGKEGEGAIYFYNIDGNRITHITLAVSQAPAGWEVTINPALAKTQVSVSGMPVTVEENLYVEPSELLLKEPQSVPEGMVSIKVPGRGYALGKLARIIIKVPESAPLGSIGDITISGEAAWLGQSGAAAVKQARDFSFNVTVFSGQTEYSETIIGKKSEAAAGQSPEQVAKTATAEAPTSNSMWIWIVVACAVIIIALVVIILRYRTG
jgi:hypothetical protein